MVREMRGRLILATTLCVTLVACSSGTGSDRRSSPTTSARTSTEGVPAFGHVFLVIGENAERRLITPSTMPFTAGTLAPDAASFTNYDAVTHHSLANYVSMTSGRYTQCDQHDHDPSICHRNVGNLFSQLDGAGLTWRSWMESMPAPCTVVNAGDPNRAGYAVRHDPAVYYDPIEGSGGQWSATTPSAGCTADVLPMGGTGPSDTSAFDAALADGSVGAFNLVVPNLCEDAHNDCGGTPTQLTQFDAFLAREVPKILASPAFGNDGLLIVTFDEGTTDVGGGGNVALYLEGPHVRPGVYEQAANHFSLLRMLEDGFRLYGYLGAAASAPPIANVWK
jgi:hypothetical protein